MALETFLGQNIYQANAEVTYCNRTLAEVEEAARIPYDGP